MAHLVRVKYLADTRKAGPGNKLTAPIDYMHRHGPVPAGGLSWQTTLVSLAVCVCVYRCVETPMSHPATRTSEREVRGLPTWHT